DDQGKPTTEVVQDLCSPTYDIPIGGTYPSSTMGPMEVELHLLNAGDAGTADDVQVTAKVTGLAFNNILPNGTTKQDTGELLATMDFRELAPLFTKLGHPPTWQTICDQLSSTPCQACADGNPSCLSAHATNPVNPVGADDRSDLKVETVTLD